MKDRILKSLKYKVFFVAFISLNLLPGSVQAQDTFTHPEGKYLIVNGARLWVETEGKGDPLFLIAGGPGDSHVYMHSFDGLKDSFLLVFIDNFGRGKSDTASDISQ
jgi:proline iminopeptidase